MAELDYYRTLIAVADDCPATVAVEPPPRGGRQTVAELQYGMLAGRPHVLTQQDVLFGTWLSRQDLPEEPSEQERARLRREFFARSQACLRASPLPKKYGWGLLFDTEGRVALCAVDSPGYRELVDGRGGVRVLKAMRSRRA